MNEPHDVPDIDKWANTVQAVVTAIRNAGAKSQMILIPGNDWTSAQQMPTKSGPALLKVKNPDGSLDGIVFDVHKYLDSDNSGTHTEVNLEWNNYRGKRRLIMSSVLRTTSRPPFRRWPTGCARTSDRPSTARRAAGTRLVARSICVSRLTS